MKTVFIFLFSLLCPLFFHANELLHLDEYRSVVSGKIEAEGSQIPFATIYLKGTTIGTSADASGFFNLNDLPPGLHTIMITAIGYKPKQMEIELPTGQRVELNIELETDHFGIEQVVVSANRNARSRKEAASIVNSINPALFDRMQSVTMSECLNFTPGIRMENNCQNCGFSQVRMNGLEGPYSQILINSRPVFSGLAGVYGLELIPVNMIERIEVIRGGGSSLYGSNAIAGTINLITRDPINNSFSVASSYGVTGTAFDGATPQPDYNININGSVVTENNRSGMTFYGFHRERKPFDANNDGFSELSSIDNMTLGTRLFQRTGSRGKLSLDYFNINEFRRGGNLFELPLHEADISESTTHRINSGSVSFDQLYREADKLSAWVAVVGVDRDSYYGANQDLSAYGNTTDLSVSSGVQFAHTLPMLIFAPAQITSGIEWAYNHLEDKKLGYTDLETGEQFGNTPVANQRMNTGALFLQSEWNVEAATVAAGLRYDRYHIDDILTNAGTVRGNVLSPRISLRYNIAPTLQFRSSYARGFRAPQIFDEDLHVETSGARQVLHRNDPDLKQETSHSLTSSLNYTIQSLTWQYQFLAEAFLTKLQNPFANEYGDPDENGVVVYTRMNAEEGATVRGINLEFNASPGRKFQFQSGFTFQKSAYQEPQEFDETRFFRSPSRYGYLVANYQLNTRVDISLTSNYTGEMLIPYFGPRLDNPEDGMLVKTSPFLETGLRVNYNVKVSRGIKAQLNAGIRNLFNSYQTDFDTGIDRDPAYIYGPLSPRTIFFGLKLGHY